ncbi:hypothetical protein ZIOFF_013864 [Zingiber officinale]|uniref:Uncharacterized protein n=1 Tax=Zingiber officinale TaxID=94328 RepID=A0A8J5H9R4_ZINOF|nr:hypothetical protein ZIOFF_013864 [Zingiber officinale]
MDVRPMMEVVKGAAFGILQVAGGCPASLRPGHWLDLYSGTGAVGIEAISRGCSEQIPSFPIPLYQAHFVEMDPWVVSKVLQPNLESTGFSDVSVIHTVRVERFLEQAEQSLDNNRTFDYVSVTPPYTEVDYSVLMDQLAKSPLVGEDCFIVSYACSWHSTDTCPSLQPEEYNSVAEQSVAAASVFPNRPQYQQGNQQVKYDPMSPTYNPGWRDHPNLRYGNNSTAQQSFPQQIQNNNFSGNQRPPGFYNNTVPNRIQPFQPFQQHVSPLQQTRKSSSTQTDFSIQDMEEIMQQMMLHQQQLSLQCTHLIRQQQRTDAALQNIERQEDSVERSRDLDSDLQIKFGSIPKSVAVQIPVVEQKQTEIHLPFPQRLVKPGKGKAIEKSREFQEMTEIFSRVEVNIPLLKAIKHIPKYAKFLKDLCVNKKKLKGDELVSAGESVSALFQAMPQKCRDPGVFTISCKIGENSFEDAMVDLGASINRITGLSIELFDELEDRLDGYLLECAALFNNFRDDLSTECSDSLDQYVSASETKDYEEDCIVEVETGKALPSVLQPPKLELKVLPCHLKYAYLRKDEQLPVIISKDLDAV